MKRKKVPVFAWLYRVAYCFVATIWRLLRDAGLVGCDSPRPVTLVEDSSRSRPGPRFLYNRCIVTFITHHGLWGISISSSSTCSHEAATIMTMLVGPERRAMNQTSAKTTLLAALKCGFFFLSGKTGFPGGRLCRQSARPSGWDYLPPKRHVGITTMYGGVAFSWVTSVLPRGAVCFALLRGGRLVPSGLATPGEVPTCNPSFDLGCRPHCTSTRTNTSRGDDKDKRMICCCLGLVSNFFFFLFP